MAKAQKKKSPKLGLIKFAQIYVVITVIVWLVALMFQMHILDNHLPYLSYLNAPPPLLTESKQSLPKPTKRNDNIFGHSCSDIVEEENDDDLRPILELLCEAGYDVSRNSDQIDRSVLPKWSDIIDFYGPPKILGLESCQRFRDTIPKGKRQMAASGIFNSGTNLLAALIRSNCNGNQGNSWQVSWGKHHPFGNRTNHFAGNSKTPHHENLPVVSIRDPYTWLQSMCRQPYGAQYDFAKETCPNLIPYPSDIKAHPRFAKMKHIPVHVKYDTRLGLSRKYESMGHLWNEWYGDYIEFESSTNAGESEQAENTTAIMKPPTVPFVVVRMEDLVFHAKTVVPQLCSCVGESVKREGQIQYVSKLQNHNRGIDNSKGAGLLRSVVNYGNITKRRDGYPAFQLEAAREILDPRLMALMGYRYEEP